MQEVARCSRVGHVIARSSAVLASGLSPRHALALGTWRHGGAATLCSGPFWKEKRDSLNNMEGRERFDMRVVRSRNGQRNKNYLSCLNAEQRSCAVEIQRLGRQRRWQEAMALFHSVVDPDLILQQVALDACARCHEVGKAWQIFNDMPTQSTTAYNSLISVLGRTRRIEEVEHLLAEMHRNTVVSTASTFTTVVVAYGMVHRVDDALRVFREIEDRGFPLTEVEFGAALTACGKSGDKLRAAEILEQMDQRQVAPHVGHLTSVIVSCARTKDEDRARKAFADLRRRGLRPDIVAFTSLVACIPGLGSTPKIEEIRAEMRIESIQPHAVFYDEVLRAAREDGDAARFSALLAESDAQGLARSVGMELQVRQLQEATQREELHIKLASPGQVGPSDSSRLPDGWRQAVDPATGRDYYWNVNDPQRTTTWECPS